VLSSKRKERLQLKQSTLVRTGVARNFDRGVNKIKKFCGVILVTFFGIAMAITSLK